MEVDPFDGLCRVNAEFVLQNGESGPRVLGLRVALNAGDFIYYPDDYYFRDVVVPRMTSRFLEEIAEAKASGKLWEGAYLVTHPDDQED